MPRAPFLCALLCLPFLVGCEGCRPGSDPDGSSQEPETPLQDFTAPAPRAFPGGPALASGGIKPGHWLSAAQPFKSNKVDARGELFSRAFSSGRSYSSADANRLPNEIVSVRPIVLPKGQQRRFDFRVLAPPPISSEQKTVILGSRFIPDTRSVYIDADAQPYNLMSGEEYFLVILTNRPERFGKWQVADWVRPFRDELAFRAPRPNYRVIIPSTKDLLPLAETMLDWTGTAVLVWDDVSADVLTPSQQTAIADWIRFGGQLIVNGADAADAIDDSLLAGVLPLRPTGNIELDPDAASDLLRGWEVPTDPSTEKQSAVLRAQVSRVAVDGRTTEDARALPRSGSLVLSRRVGRGRVVQPRFDITSDWIANWYSYDSFVNAVLLARPHRQFILTDPALDAQSVRQRYAALQLETADPAINTQLRITARDAVLPISQDQASPNAIAASRIDPLTRVDAVRGIAGWSDSSDVMAMSRQILRNESGIEIPDSSLVIRSLGYYLLLLVPLNYLFFKLIGRLEYAWLAVPFIAIGGAIWVARAARLDIGFARSQTEIALLELQPEYPRGHLTRVLAIYNSLSSSYDLQFESVDGCAAPIDIGAATLGDPPIFKTAFAEGPALSGVSVGSNQIRMIHAEQIVDVGGPVRLDADDQLINESSLELFDAFVIRKSESDEVQIATVGGCAPGSAVKLRFRDSSRPAITDQLPMQTVRMIRRLASPAAMPSGSTRLVARVDQSIPGMTVTPSANQVAAQTVLLAHLRHAPMPEPQVDINLIGDIRRRPLQDDDIPTDQ